MARGFESKDVEFQQTEAERAKTPQQQRALTVDEREDAARRRTLELSLARARSELENALVPAHRRMLERAIGDLERQLAAQASGPA